MTCKELKKLMIPVYRIKYGHEPAPSVSVTSSCWKRFAIQHEAHRSDSDQIRDEVIDNILEFYFDSPDHTLLMDAEDVIYYLHDNPHIHSRGIEAIFVALNIQHRREESNAFWLRYCDSDAIPLERMALLQARFKVDFPISWSTFSSEVLERCLLAAATSGNMELFLYLKQLLLEIGKDIQVHQAANAAVRSDRMEMLQYLQSTFGVEFHTLPLSSLMEVAVKFGSVNAVQALLEFEPRIDLEYPYKLALLYCNTDVLRRLTKHSSHMNGTYLPNGQLQIAFILANGLASWASMSKTIEFLVKHVSADINATGRDGLAAVHVAAINNHIDALKLFENLGANMMSLGEVGQTPVEIALCNGHDIPFIGSSSLPKELFATKQSMAKAIIGEYCAAIFKKQQKCSGFNTALNGTRSKLADIWAKKIGLKTLEGLIDMIGTPLFESVKKFLGIITGFDTMPVELREEQFQDVDDIKDVLNKFLNQQYPDWFLTRLACYSVPRLVPLDIEHLRIFVNSETDRALHLGRCSFAQEELNIQSELRTAFNRI